jgi:hypothetical protein
MGRRTEESYDDELLKKFKTLFEEVYEKMKKENVSLFATSIEYDCGLIEKPLLL